MMMMMSQPIQPSINRSALPSAIGNQGFISGRQRLQQQAPATAKPTDTATTSYGNRKNQALVTTENDTWVSDKLTAPHHASEAILPTQRNTRPSNRSNQTTATNNTLAYQEIQDIAQKAGYVGVSQRDIDRAYRLNKSLLVDYRA
jgi:hypothetical protein